MLVDETAASRDRWTETLRRAGHHVFAFADAAAALETAGRTPFDLAVLSFADPPSCLDLQKRLKSCNPACQITLLTERPHEERDALALESGARAVLLKPVDPVALGRVVERAAHSHRVRAGRPRGEESLHAILGRSAPIENVRSIVRKVAAVSDTSVLITGESGTGKELVARAIHGLSRRSDEAFLEVNCAAIPEHLLESELFGHEQGAFTDASRMKPGLFELADGGTLFLDEIGEMPPGLQAKLLRVIDTRSMRRIGGQETLRLDLRIIAATNRDLLEGVRAGRFRDDLYHRLNVVRIHMPPLRERSDDLALLATHFAERFARKFGRESLSLGPGVLEMFAAYPWPGNVRELVNQIERAALLSPGPVLETGDFPLLAQDPPTSAGTVRIRAGDVEVDFSGGPVPLEEVERLIIGEALETAGWNISEAARLLQIGRGALRYKMERHGLVRRALAG